MRLKEIEARLAQIKQELTTRAAELTAAEIDALEKEVEELQEERAALQEAAERRRALLAKIAAGEPIGDEGGDDSGAQPTLLRALQGQAENRRRRKNQRTNTTR